VTDIQIIVGGFTILWIALAFQISSGFRMITDRQDRIWERTNEQLDGLREYLYEIDPQFDEERELLDGLHSDDPNTVFDGMQLMELEKSKKKVGRRTLSSRFFEGGFRSPRQGDFQP
jgi:hypothetical protein